MAVWLGQTFGCFVRFIFLLLLRDFGKIQADVPRFQNMYKFKCNLMSLGLNNAVTYKAFCQCLCIC